MELNEFIGKAVIDVRSNTRYRLHTITSPKLVVIAERVNENGYRETYSFPTINGDPVSSGTLVFEDPALTSPFLKAYAAYCATEDAYWEEYDYWMRRG